MIPRIGASVTFYGTAVLRQFEMQGVYPLNESVAIGRSRDKLRSMQLLARDGIGLPVATFAQDPKQTDAVLKLAGGAPTVIKLLEGTQGIGVVLTDTDRSVKSVIATFRDANVNILIQEFIKEAGGTDMLRANHGPVVMEVNSSPGLEGIEDAMGKDIAGKDIEFLEEHTKTGGTKTRGKG